MPVKDKVAKMLYIDNVTAGALKEIADVFKVSESLIMRKALYNYIGLYQDLAKQDPDWKKKMLTF